MRSPDAVPGLRSARSKAVRVANITAPEQDAAPVGLRTSAWSSGRPRPGRRASLDDHAIWLCDRVSASGLAGTSQDRAGLGQAVRGRARAGVLRLALDKRRQFAARRRRDFACPAVFRRRLASRFTGDGPWIVKPALAVDCLAARVGSAGRTGKYRSSAPVARPRRGGHRRPSIAQSLIEGTGEGVFGPGDRR